MAHYVRATGDVAVLDEGVPFLDAPVLAPEVTEAYLQPRVSAGRWSLFEHCVRAIDRGLTVGTHGLPLMGSGDWNDGMNRVGREGRGESTWLGFFLHVVLSEFAPLCAARGDQGRADRYRSEATRLAAMLERTWPDYTIVWRVGRTRYEIAVSNPARRCRGVGEAELDGVSVDARAIPLVDDGGTHRVRVVLGEQPGP